MDERFKLKVKLNGPKSTLKFAAQIGRNLKGGEVIELSSDLGGGKTTLVRGMAEGAGSHDHVSSPTFTIRNDYRAKDIAMAHFDFYRLSDPGLIKEMLAEVIIDPDTAVVIEWPDVVDDILPSERVVITLTPTGHNTRELTIDSPGRFSYLFSGVSGK